MAHELPAKLRVTAALLGCAARKDLCARFRAVNPATQFDLERSHKWLQGKALPRSPLVYEDWARVLGTSRPGAWLAACAMDAFLDEVCALYAADRAELVGRAGLGAGPGRSTAAVRTHYACGRYMAYSHAWSPYYAGHLIRGPFEIAPGRGGRLEAHYDERLPGGALRFSGPMALSGRLVHAHLREPTSDGPLFLSLVLPGRPASVLAGVMAGATFMSPDPLPCATRIALVRLPDRTAPAAPRADAYLEPAALAADLERSGLGPPGPVAAALLAFLGRGGAGGLDQVGHHELADLTELLDRTVLPSTGAPEAPPPFAGVG